MARALRITYRGAFYHITSRGNERKERFIEGKKANRDLAALKALISEPSIEKIKKADKKSRKQTQSVKCVDLTPLFFFCDSRFSG